MDLKDLKPNSDTIVVTLHHPATFETLKTEDGKDMTIEVYAPHSLKYKEVVHEQGNRQLEKMQKNKKYKFTVQELEDFSIERLAKTTKDWHIQLNGTKPKFTLAKAAELYKDFPWIVEQIQEAVTDSALFLTA
jgi:hypothetical protein